MCMLFYYFVDVQNFKKQQKLIVFALWHSPGWFDPCAVPAVSVSVLVPLAGVGQVSLMLATQVCSGAGIFSRACPTTSVPVTSVSHCVSVLVPLAGVGIASVVATRVCSVAEIWRLARLENLVPRLVPVRLILENFVPIVTFTAEFLTHTLTRSLETVDR